LADEALEDAIYDSQALRDFVGIDLGVESVPDAMTLLLVTSFDPVGGDFYAGTPFTKT